MPLAPGTRIGSYEIVSLLGAGGMGEVFRARDTKLNRDVAIKVLPDSVALDRERRARFEREAQTLAAFIDRGPAFHPGTPRVLFEPVYNLRSDSLRSYDFDPVSGRLLIIRPVEETQSPSIRFTLHWFDEVRRLTSGR